VTYIDRDLFGEPIANPEAAQTASLRKRRIGYADRPGTGPKGKRCYCCARAIRMESSAGILWRCEITVQLWQRPNSDIKPGAPACASWESKQYEKRRF
jgi:hypothetical protein